MKSEAYIRAVSNLAKCVEHHKDFTEPFDLQNLRFSLLVLKMQPQFTGDKLPTGKDRNERRSD